MYMCIIAHTLVSRTHTPHTHHTHTHTHITSLRSSQNNIPHHDGVVRRKNRETYTYDSQTYKRRQLVIEYFEIHM